MEFYLCNSKMKPEKLVFYRDGVSEGQFETVQRLEIPQVSASGRAPELEVETHSSKASAGRYESLLVLCMIRSFRCQSGTVGRHSLMRMLCMRYTLHLLAYLRALANRSSS